MCDRGRTLVCVEDAIGDIHSVRLLSQQASVAVACKQDQEAERLRKIRLGHSYLSMTRCLAADHISMLQLW